MTWATLMDSYSMPIHEEDVIKLILEFLSTRHYHVTMRTLEKESGVTNCDYSDEVLFLRDLVMDGDFDEIIQFGNSFTGTTSFNQKRFNFIVLKQKYIELIYTKSHIVGKQTFNIIEDVMKTLSELKCYCSSKEEYSDFCWLLTVPNLNSVDQFKNWSLDISRLTCFEELLDCLTFFMPLVKKKVNSKRVSSNDRLLHLVVKGLFYESCIEYCQSVGSGSTDTCNEFLKKDLLKCKFEDYSSNLVSWVLSLPHEAFVTPFQQIEIDVRFNRLAKRAFMADAFDIPNVLKSNQPGNVTSSITDPAAKSKTRESLNGSFDVLSRNEIVNGKAETVNTKKNALLFNSDSQNANISSLKMDSAQNADQTRTSVLDTSDPCLKTSLPTNSNIYMNHNSSERTFDTDSHCTGKKISHLEDPIKNTQDSSDSTAYLQNGGGLTLNVVRQDSLPVSSSSSSGYVNVPCTPSTPSQSNMAYFIPVGSATHTEREIKHPQEISASSTTAKNNTEKYTEPVIQSPICSTNRGKVQNDASSKVDRVETHPKVSKPTKVPVPVKATKPDILPPAKPDSQDRQSSAPDPPLHLRSPGTNRKKKPDSSSHSSDAKKNQVEQKRHVMNTSKDSKISTADNIKDLKKYDGTPKKNQTGDLHIVSKADNPVTSTPKAKVRDPSATTVSTILPVHKKDTTSEVAVEKRPVNVHAGRADSEPKSITHLHDVDKETLPIGYYDTPGRDANAGDADCNLGPLINGVRRPISKVPVNLPAQQVSEQSQENVSPLKGPGPKITTKDGQKVHLNELIEEKFKEDSNANVSGNLLPEEDVIFRYSPMAVLEDAQAVRAVAFHPNGQIYAIGANSKILRICDMSRNQNTCTETVQQMSVLHKRSKYHRGSIYCMDWSPDGCLLATGSNDKSIKILQFDEQHFSQTRDEIELNIHNGTVRELAFIPNKTGLLISGGTGDGNINITDTITQKIVGTLNGHTGNVMSVYAGVELVATAGTDNAVRLWDLRSRRCIDVVIVGESCPASVALGVSDKYLASGQEDGSILLYDVIAGRTLQNYQLHQSDCRSVRFSGDHKHLLTSSYDHSITLMHFTEKIELQAPDFYNVGQHADKVIQCRWHPTENVFLSSSADKTAVLWKCVT